MYRVKARKKSFQNMQDAEAKLAKYDISNTGTLSREEVLTMAKDLLNTYTPEVGGITDEDIDMIMRCGGDNVKPELTKGEIAHALALMAILKDYNKWVVELFAKFDVDKSGKLSADQLKPLLKDVNGKDPEDKDITYILKQCEPRLASDPISKDQLKAALACWYCLQDQTVADKVKESFDLADTKGNGVIEKDELRALLGELNKTFKDQELDDMVGAIFGKFDTNKSGVLEYEQFVDWLLDES